MSDSFLDRLPSKEREKIRKRLRSPEEYERLRERVKGPEDLERELKRSEQMAEASFRLETEPRFAESFKDKIQEDLQERGAEAILEYGNLPPDVRKALEQGKFKLAVQSHPLTHEDALVVLPEGNITDRLPIKPSLTQQYVQGMLGKSGQ